MARTIRPSTQALPERRLRRIARPLVVMGPCAINSAVGDKPSFAAFTSVQRLMRVGSHWQSIEWPFLEGLSNSRRTAINSLTSIGEMEPESRFSGSIFFERCLQLIDALPTGKHDALLTCRYSKAPASVMARSNTRYAVILGCFSMAAGAQVDAAAAADGAAVENASEQTQMPSDVSPIVPAVKRVAPRMPANKIKPASETRPTNSRPPSNVKKKSVD